MLDSVSGAIANAPVEDEVISAEEKRAVTDAHEWLKHNKPIPHDDVLAELGLTMDEPTGRTRPSFPVYPNKGGEE